MTHRTGVSPCGRHALGRTGGLPKDPKPKTATTARGSATGLAAGVDHDRNVVRVVVVTVVREPPQPVGPDVEVVGVALARVRLIAGQEPEAKAPDIAREH